MRKCRGNDLDLGPVVGDGKVILSHAKRLEHLSIFGLTGTGKSRYLEGLVRQDIRNWPRTHCGLLLIDRHGDLFDGIMQWVGANELKHLPIIPIDLSRPDQIISYNPLRRRATDPSVIIDSIVRGAAYVWGQQGTDDTPLFERWATNILHRLYQEGRTLADAAHLFTREGLVIDAEIHDPLIRNDWLEARRNWKNFETNTQSTVNRFRRFLLNTTLRAMFGQTDSSLDLGQALVKGQIILVSLAQRGGIMSPENADLVATLLLSDLWTAAAERGKGDHVKPFYCILDEFQRFLSPSLAENLAEARGFGIGMTMASQHPRQLINGGENGVRIYDEVMENARTKMVFRLSSRPNLEPMAEQLCMRALDPYRVKHQHFQVTTVGHEIRYLPSFGETSTNTIGGAQSKGHTSERNHSVGTNWSHTDAESESISEGDTLDEGVSLNVVDGMTISMGRNASRSESESEGDSESDSDTSNWTETESESSGRTVTDGTNWSKGKGRNKSLAVGESSNDSQAMTFGHPSKEFQEDLADSSAGRLSDEEEAKFQRKWVKGLTVTRGNTDNKSETTGTSDMQSDGGSRTSADSRASSRARSRGGVTTRAHARSNERGRSDTQGESTALARSAQTSLGIQAGRSHSETTTYSTSSADTIGGSETFGKSEADTLTDTDTWSNATGTIRTDSPHVIPILAKEAAAPIFLPIDEQIAIWMTKIARLPDRHAFVLTSDMDVPVMVRTPDIHRPSLSLTVCDLFIGWYQRQSGLAVETVVAQERIRERDGRLFGCQATRPNDEPTEYRKRLKAPRPDVKNT